MPYQPPETVSIPNHVLAFARDFSLYKTPARRTRGAQEAGNQQRGEPDWIDTVATLMLWQELVRADIPTTFFLTANTGDETDLRVQRKGSDTFIDINVKGTKTSVPEDTTPAQYGNLPLKHEELGLDLPRQGGGYAPHPNPVRLVERDGRPWAVADHTERLADLYLKVFVHTGDAAEGQGDHVHLTNWLPVAGADFQAQITALNTKIAKGRPDIIPGIWHPGIWAPSAECRPYLELFTYLEQVLQQEDPHFVLRWKRLDVRTAQKRLRDELRLTLMAKWIEFDADSEIVTVTIPDQASPRKEFDACRARQNEVETILREGFDTRVVNIHCGQDVLSSLI